MAKNLSALAYMSENAPELAERYLEKVKQAKRERSKLRQRLMAKAFAGSKENTPANE
jgi:hypothetical protein